MRLVWVAFAASALAGCASTQTVLSKEPTEVFHSKDSVNTVAFCLANKNNTPALALQTVFSTLGAAGVVPDRECIVQTQRRNEVSPALAF